jgi:hypothetical protein
MQTDSCGQSSFQQYGFVTGAVKQCEQRAASNEVSPLPNYFTDEMSRKYSKHRVAFWDRPHTKEEHRKSSGEQYRQFIRKNFK